MAYQKDHTYWVISYGGNGRALSVYGNSQVSENRNVILWDKQNIKDQLWLVKVGSGFARLHTTLDTSYYFIGDNCHNHFCFCLHSCVRFFNYLQGLKLFLWGLFLYLYKNIRRI